MADYIIRRKVMVTMRDGVSLATDVWLPAADGQFPTLLQRTPYGRDVAFGTQHIVGMENLRALDAGFAVVIQDCRGRFDSDGAFDPFIHESDDGVDTMGWIRAQAFSDGRVATYGASYIGATQMLLAMQGPEGHVAMAPYLTAGDYRRGWANRSGALQLGFLWLWIIEGLAPADADHRGLSAEDPVRHWLAEASTDPTAAMSRVPLLSDEVLEAAPYLADWVSDPPNKGYWHAIDALRDVSKVRARALHIVGLNDIFAEGSLRSYAELREHGATRWVRDGQYLVLGPWSHGNISDWQGDQWLGYEAAASALDLAGLQLDFFAAAMEDRTPALPRVQYFVSGLNEWRTSEEWPPPGREHALYLSSEHRLVPEPPTEGGTDGFRSDPADPVPTVGGQTFLPGVSMGKNSGPMDQRDVEVRPDVLVLQGSPLEQALTLAGPVRLELWAHSSAADCDWTARLVDIDRSGASRGIADGILRSRYRHGDEPQALVPGEPELFVVDVGTIAHRFATGHRIGLQIASSNFPRFDRNPQQMVDPVRAGPDDFVIADQTVHYGADRASRLVLPMLTDM